MSHQQSRPNNRNAYQANYMLTLKTKKMKTTIMLFVAACISLTGFAQTNAPKTDTEKQATHSCPMHPEITGSATDKCSKCKMALTPVKKYVCPMHADVTANKKAKCSKCGMDLTEVKEKSKKE